MIYVLVAVGGIVIGSVGHSFLAKEAAASKADIFAWSQELRTVVTADAVAAKTKIEALITKIEKKL